MRKSIYQVGYNHGVKGIRYLAHRKLRPYDSASANRAYTNGYQAGYKKRGKAFLDYSNPLNNQLFITEPTS